MIYHLETELFCPSLSGPWWFLSCYFWPLDMGYLLTATPVPCSPCSSADVITNLEPDILECEVKRALGNITMNRGSGGDGIPVELFQILKMLPWKCCTQYASKLANVSSGHRTRKSPFSFQSQRKAIPKNAQTTPQLHSSHTIAK